MAPLDDLYQALAVSNEQKKAISDSNPYTPAANIFGQLGTTIATSGPQYSLRDKLIYGAITGLFGGALTGLADRRNSNAQAAYTDVVRRSLAGETNIQQPEDLPSSLFSSAQEAGQMALFKREITAKAAEQELQRELEKSTKVATIAKALENPKKAPEVIKTGQDALAILTGKKPSGIQLANTGTAPVNVAGEQIDPELQKIIDQRNSIADATDPAFANKVMEDRSKALADAAKSAKEKESANIEQADKIRKEIQDLEEVKKFKEVSDRYTVLKAAFTDPAKISDLDYIYGVAKILDPTSVVREGEAGMVIDSQSLPSSMLGRLNGLISGGQALDSAQRLDLLRLAGRHYDTLGSKIEAKNAEYSTLAKARDIRLEDLQLLPTKQSSIPTDTAAQQQYIAQIASKFPNTPEGRQMFKDAIGLMGR